MLKKYDAVVNGYPTTLLLSDEDAQRGGYTSQPAKAPAKAEEPVEPKKAPAPANKARSAANKGAATGSRRRKS